LAGSTTKKVILRRRDREPLSGYVNPLTFQQSTGVELLSAQGNVSVVPYEEIQTVAFVREFDTPEAGRNLFYTRPKMEGLWIRLQFHNGELLEGVMPPAPGGRVRDHGHTPGSEWQQPAGVCPAGGFTLGRGPRGGRRSAAPAAGQGGVQGAAEAVRRMTERDPGAPHLGGEDSGKRRSEITIY